MCHKVSISVRSAQLSAQLSSNYSALKVKISGILSAVFIV